MQQLSLSLRAYVKVLRVSRTIADLDGSERVQVPQVAEAIQYRLFDREASEAGERHMHGVLRPRAAGNRP